MGNIMGGVGPSFMKKKKNNYSDDDQQSTGADTTKTAADNLGRFGGAMKGSSSGDAVSRIQKYAQDENERKKKEDEEKKKKAAAAQKSGSVAPQKGFIQRMIDKYYYGKEDQ